MNAVGIDVSKGKSTVTIRRLGDEVVMDPRDIPHTQSSVSELITLIKGMEGETKVCMEHTGRYYEPVATWLSDAGIFVSAVNPALIKNYGDESIRAPKTDKADAKKIARFALDRWAKLRQYGRMDEIRNQLKTMNRQFGFYMNQKTAMLNIASVTVESLRTKMNETAAQFPEYPVVMGMDGVGFTLRPQLIAEIGDVTRFTKRESLTAFAGVDPRANESGTYKQKSTPTTKKGSRICGKRSFRLCMG